MPNDAAFCIVSPRFIRVLSSVDVWERVVNWWGVNGWLVNGMQGVTLRPSWLSFSRTMRRRGLCRWSKPYGHGRWFLVDDGEQVSGERVQADFVTQAPLDR
jgi:hypothetical protein